MCMRVSMSVFMYVVCWFVRMCFVSFDFFYIFKHLSTVSERVSYNQSVILSIIHSHL